MNWWLPLIVLGLLSVGFGFGALWGVLLGERSAYRKIRQAMARAAWRMTDDLDQSGAEAILMFTDVVDEELDST